MKPNEDRIWDILIEDALREGSVDQPAQPVGDHTRRLLTPVGAPGIDRGRSLREPSRRKWLPASVSVALLLLVAAILYAGIVYLPQLAESRTDQPQAADENQSPSRQQRDNTPPAPKQTPEPQPEDSSPVDQPDDSGPIAPEPDVTPERPKPEPKPDDTVEQPKPEPKPDDTVEQPKPEPKPDDSVEEPTSNDPEDHSTSPVREPEAGYEVRLLSASKGANLQVANYDATGDWDPPYRNVKEETEFADSSWFKCSKPVDLVAGGVFLRLDGEVRLEVYRGGGALLLDPKKGTLYLDTRGSLKGAYISLTQSDESFSISAGSVAALLEASSSSVEVSAFDGELRLEDDGGIVSAGKRATIRNGKLGSLKELRKPIDQEAFLDGIVSRSVYRENFDSGDPKGRLREGKLEDGIIKGATVFWGYPENIPFEPGLVIRMRLRFTGESSATLSQFCPERNDNYSAELLVYREVVLDEWYVLEVRVDEMLERTKHEGHPQVGESFQNISIQLEGENAQVELDWVELIRAVK